MLYLYIKKYSWNIIISRKYLYTSINFQEKLYANSNMIREKS